MKYVVCLFLILFFIKGFAQNPIEKEGWELTFNDEFNAQKIDYTKWQNNYYWGGRTNTVDVNYYGKNQFEFTDSTLLIKAEEKESKKGFPYTSGMLDCNKSFQQQYGYFEIRMKLPNSTGFWPAFWLVSVEKWPPEIDILEVFTNNLQHLSTTHHWINKRGKKKKQAKGYKIEDASTDFHTYAAEWTKKKIIWYYDNKKIRSSRVGSKYFIYKMHIMINLGISTFKGMDITKAVLPNYLEIDYVRAYKFKGK